MPTPATAPPTLITIPVSHYAEKARWALDHVGQPFTETALMPPFHRRATAKAGGRQVPVLVTAAGAISDSDAILQHLDRQHPGRLYPLDLATDPVLARRRKSLEDLCNNVLGAHVRRWGYSYILNRRMLGAAWTHGVPFWQKMLFPVIYPGVEPKVREMMKITDTSGPESFVHVADVFAQIDRALADGRRYLLGDTFSATDITFAALAAPILLPPEHPMQKLCADQAPEQMRKDIARIAATSAGRFGLRLYRENRHVRTA
jgi:glutathione S-transferase